MKYQFRKVTKSLLIASLGVILSITSAVTHAKEVSATSAVQIDTAKQQQVVNLNKSTFEELVTLKGIGHTKAQAIIVYRQEVGGFKSVKELTKVSGIGDKIVSENKTRLSI